MQSLPLDVRRQVASLYNWNWVLVPALQEEFDRWYAVRKKYEVWTAGFAQDGFEVLAHRVVHWIHLLDEDARNWRIPVEGDKIAVELERRHDLYVKKLREAFVAVLEYNRPYFCDRPET